MADEAQVTEETLNLEENQDSNLESESVVESEELTKAQELAQNYKIRAEKAEKALKAQKQTPKEETVTPKNDRKRLSLEELDEASELLEIPKDDRSEVVKYADREGISIAEAKKKTFIQVYLKTKAEERKSAEAANTSTTRRSNKKDDSESLLEDFSKGKMPDSAEGIRRLAEAQLAQRKASLKR